MSRPTTVYVPDAAAYKAALKIRSILNGELDAGRDFVDEGYETWLEIVEAIEEAYREGCADGGKDEGIAQAKTMFLVMTKHTPELLSLMEDMKNAFESVDVGSLLGGAPKRPTIPEQFRGPSLEGLGDDACRWLDAYIEFSRGHSSRGFELFHEGVGLWILSAVAMRRVRIPMLQGKFTPLYIILASNSSKYAKTTTAMVGIAMLKAAGFGNLVLTGNKTPQVFVHMQSGRIDKEYGAMTPSQQEEERDHLRYAGKLAMWNEEFGHKLRSFAQENGIYRDYHDIFLQFDDSGAPYSNRTIGRGNDHVEDPYLAMLCNMTPENVRNLPKGCTNLWEDGTFPRMVLLTPEEQSEWEYKPPQFGMYTIPEELSAPLERWHEELGIPELIVQEKMSIRDQPTGEYTAERFFPEPRDCSFEEGAWQAYIQYEAEMLTLVNTSPEVPPDLHPWYTRLPEKMLRVAALMASLENDNLVELRHIARAVQICERWRNCAHHFLYQINLEAPTIGSKREAQIMTQVTRMNVKGKWPTAADVARGIRNLSPSETQMHLEGLVKSGVLLSVQYKSAGRNQRLVTRYGIPNTPLPPEALGQTEQSEQESEARAKPTVTYATTM